MKTKCEYSGTLFIISRKYFSVFRGPHLPQTPRHTILDSMFPPCNAISEGRLPLCSTSSDAGALPSEVRIENDSDRKFSKSIFFQTFSGNHFYPRFMVRCSLLHISRKYFFSFSKSALRTYPSIHHFGLEASPL